MKKYANVIIGYNVYITMILHTDFQKLQYWNIFINNDHFRLTPNKSSECLRLTRELWTLTGTLKKGLKTS